MQTLIELLDSDRVVDLEQLLNATSDAQLNGLIVPTERIRSARMWIMLNEVQRRRYRIAIHIDPLKRLPDGRVALDIMGTHFPFGMPFRSLRSDDLPHNDVWNWINRQIAHADDGDGITVFGGRMPVIGLSVWQIRSLILIPGVTLMDSSVVGQKMLEDLLFSRYSPVTLASWYRERLSSGNGSCDNAQRMVLESSAQFREGEIANELAQCSLRRSLVAYGTNAQWIQNGRKEPFTLPLLIHTDSSQTLYRGSRRPVNDMSLFRTPNSPTLGGNRPNDAVGTSGFIPVTRYAAGMSGGLYFDEDEDDDQEYCGTFYYYEPESTTFLYARRVLQSINKVDALRYMLQAWARRERRPFVFNCYPLDQESGKLEAFYAQSPERAVSQVPALQFRRIIDDEDAHLRLLGNEELASHSLMMTPLEFLAAVRRYGMPEELLKDTVNLEALKLGRAETRPYYTGHVWGFYAVEDALDQPICELGRALGYDLIIMANVTGARQRVTEVLDTRPRDVSFANLHYLN